MKREILPVIYDESTPDFVVTTYSQIKQALKKAFLTDRYENQSSIDLSKKKSPSLTKNINILIKRKLFLEFNFQTVFSVTDMVFDDIFRYYTI